MEVADRRTACESSSSGLSPKRMPHYPIGILFYYYISKQCFRQFPTRNQQFQAAETTVPCLGNLSFKLMKLQFQAGGTLVSNSRNQKFYIDYLFHPLRVSTSKPLTFNIETTPFQHRIHLSSSSKTFFFSIEFIYFQHILPLNFSSLR